MRPKDAIIQRMNSQSADSLAESCVEIAKRPYRRGLHLFQRKGYWYAYLGGPKRKTLSLHTTSNVEAAERLASMLGRAEATSAKAASRGYVYFVRAQSGPVKIGWTRGLRSRMNGLQTHHYETLELIGVSKTERSAERDMHRRLREYRIRGEWFVPTEAVMCAIDAMLTEHPAATW